MAKSDHDHDHPLADLTPEEKEAFGRKLLKLLREYDATGITPGDEQHIIPGTYRADYRGQLLRWTSDGDAEEDTLGQAHVGQTGTAVYAIPNVDRPGHKLWVMRFADGERLYCLDDDLRFD